MSTGAKKLLLACGMLRDEIQKHLPAEGAGLDVVWLEAGLHEAPQKLHAALQGEIDHHPGYSHILLGFGLCGNSALGLKSRDATLVLPRFDDCVRMLLVDGGDAAVPTRLYYTRGWVEGEHFLLNRFEAYQKKYGPHKTEKLLRRMYRNYTGIHLIDTGAYDVAAALPAIEAAGSVLGLAPGVSRGSTRVLQKLLHGPWDGDFCVAPPGTAIGIGLFLNGAAP